MLRLDSVSKHFGSVVAVQDVSLDVQRGELLTLLGPSGCGKTTTLRMIAGFEPVSGGRILLDGRDVTRLPPQKRGVGMVFQNYALFPHLDVFENVAFGLKARGTPGAEIPRRVERALELVDLPGYARRRVQALSGGQQQRVALARALAPEPPVLLLDEPLSNLDAALRERTREELRAVLRRIGITSVFVTHDQEEAFALSDRVALMSAGRVEQLGPPEELYSAPASPFAAAFVGRASFLPATVVAAQGDALLCQVAAGARWRARPAPGFHPVEGEAVRVMLRPEWLALAATPVAGPEEPGRTVASPVPNAARVPDAPGALDAPDALPAEVLDRRFAGAMTFYRVQVQPGAGVGEPAELLVQADARAAAPGDAVRVRAVAPAIAYPPERGDA